MIQILLGAWPVDGWFVEKLGRGRPNPVTISVAEMARYEQDRARVMYEHLGEFGMGSPDPTPSYAVPQHDGRNIIASAFGAAYPEWDELSASYSDAMCRLYNRPRTAWCSLGGDNSCLVSAEMYREYAMPFDALVREKCGNLPRNLHSCGASSHLYKVWGEYPERAQIVVMQTRAIPGAMAPLRESLPHTHIELTIHQPQVDFEKETPDRVKALVWEFAEALGFHNMRILVLFSRVDARVKRNLDAFFEAGREVNAEAERRHAKP